MRLEQDWPFKQKLLVLSKAEIAALNKAAGIAERAADLSEPESDEWYMWKSLEHSARVEA